MSAFDKLTTLTLKKDGGTDTLDLIRTKDGSIYFNETAAAAATGEADFTGQPSDGDTLVVNDGYGNEVTFEFESSGGVASGNTAVTIGADADATASNFASAVDSSDLRISASASTGTVTLTHDLKDNAGNEATVDASNATNVSGTDFSGGGPGVRKHIVNQKAAKNLFDALDALDS